MKVKTPRLAVLKQIDNYIFMRERDNWYSGNKEQFEKRHIEAKKWIESLIKEATK